MTESEKSAKAREREIVKAIKECRQLAREAKDASAWTATGALFRQEQQLRKDLADHRATMARQVTPEGEAANMTPEEWAERLRIQSASLTDQDLDVFIAEWRKRNKLVAVGQQDGSIHLVRRAV